MKISRERQGLSKLEENSNFIKKVYKEVDDSTINLLKYLSKYAPVYFIQGNVGISKKFDVKKEYKKYRVKLIPAIERINKIKNVYFVQNNLRAIQNLRIGFLEYFLDTNWVEDFKPKDYEKKLKKANKQTKKAKQILNRFKTLDVLVCHQPPYGYLDKVSSKYNPPKNWIGKNAGSKIILEYIKKFQLKYVFCGHIHEGEGKSKIGKTEIYNLGVASHKIIDFELKKK